MAEKLIISELDFETIKTNLKQFLQSQQTFLDYNFEGSALSILINLLAYNTYYNSFYYNMIANEMFMDSAQIRNSVLSHAKALNYLPVSRRAPTAIVNLTVTPPGGNTQSVLTMERFTEFQSEAIDGVNYTFVNTGAQTVYKENGVFLFSNLDIKAGTPQVATFTYDSVTNPSSQFDLPNDDIDTSTMLMTVQVSDVNTSSEVYTLSTDITDLTANSAVYYLSPTNDNKYRVSFGDGRISKALSNGNIVIASYLSTVGEAANKANSFATGSIGGFSNVIISPISSASGGAERESTESIRSNAPISYTSQGRAVTQKDYEVLLKARYPNIQSVFVWGGEDNIPPVYGKVFVSIAPKTGAVLNNAEKERIVSELLTPIAVLTVTPVLVDPDYVYLKFETSVEVNGRETLFSSTQVASLVRDAIITYADDTFNQFGASFVISKFSRQVDDSLQAILGSETSVRLEKRFTPNLNRSTTYTVSFSTALRHAPIQDGLKSTAFTTRDSAGTLRTAYLEEVFNSSTGIDSITITNPGYNYTVAPTVTITGDGSGAIATATIVNGKIETINVVRRGTGYTSALVTIEGDGSEGAASAVVQSKYGTLRTFYYNSNSEKVDINPEIGTVDYQTGELTINNLNVVESLLDSGDIRIDVQPQSAIIETQRNQLLLLDTDDSSAISIAVTIR
jgi:hypothetical protein